MIDTTTGEILQATAIVRMPDASELQRYQSDEDLIEFTERVLAFGKSSLNSASAITDVQDARAKVLALDKYIKQTMRDRQSKIEARNNLAELVLRQQRKLGVWLKVMPKNKGLLLKGQHDPRGSVTEPRALTLDDLNITKKQSARWQKEAAIPEDEFEDIIQTVKENLWELSSIDLLYNKRKGYDGDEWFTPSEYISAARDLMGGIDCDPASCELAQRVVKAATYYTIKEDGLQQSWNGRVWLNPPYSQPKIEEFTTRLIEQYEAGNTTEAVLLVNNCTDVVWFIELAKRYPVMFSAGRTRFWQADQKQFQTRQGQAIFYLGERTSSFFAAFSELAYSPNVFQERQS